jgi:deoxyhypusine synthase
MARSKDMGRTKIRTVNSLVSSFKKMAFQARALAEATDILEEMVRDKECVRVLSFAGALVPGGLRPFIAETISHRIFDVVVTTGANVTHDAIEALGFRHRVSKRLPSDAALFKSGRSRIYDVLVPKAAFTALEEEVGEVLKSLQETTTVSMFLTSLAKCLRDGDSILAAALKSDVPIFCPTLVDSALGVMISTREGDRAMDPFKDRKMLVDRLWEAKRSGILILGGGAPKNFAFQSMEVTSKGFDYAIQVTTDRAEFGGLSGASLSEAISWGKVKKDAKIMEVFCDATIAFPLMVSALEERLPKSFGMTTG